MQLQHPASFDIVEFYKIIDVQTLSEFIRNVVKYGKVQDPDIYDPLSYMGDCWEVFAEFFFKFHNGENTLTYLWDYKPNLGIDNGIDGFGKSTIDGSLATVQCKFVSNSNKYLGNEHNVGNHATSSLNEGWRPNGKNLICFTSAAGVHRSNAYADQALCLNRKLISRRVDNNTAFWPNFREVIKNQSYDKE